MSSRVIDIIIRTNDQTSAGLIAIQSKFLAMERSIQRLANRMKSFASARFQATVSLIDRVTEPGGRINAILKRFAEKAYRISVGITDSASSKLQSLNTLAAKLVSRTYTIAVNVKDNASKKLSGLTEGLMMGAGTFAPIAGAAGIGFGAANAVQAYMAFEKQMSAVQAVRQLDKDSSEMQALTQQAKDIGAQTAWTREQVGQAQYFAALAGWSTQQILQSTPHLVNLASAGNVDLKSASDIVTDSLTGFGLKAEETYVDKQGRTVNAVEHYADMMAKLQASSNTDILQMGEAFKYGAPTIGAMYSGKDIQTRMQAAEDAMIMTGLMANAGIKGSSAGTGINTIFNRMGSMNRNAYQALRAMGVDYQDEKGDMLSIGTIMRNLGSRFKEVVDPNQLLNFAEAISGEKIHADTRRKLDSFIEQTQKNGGKMSGADMLKMSSMLAGTEHMGKLLSVMLGDWDEMAAKMDNVHGTAQDMANIQLDNLAGDITILGSAWDAFQQDLVEGSASEGLRSFVQTLTEIISNAQNLFKDGIQIGDFGKIIFDVVDRLRAKFMELDGIGSILAGGVLMGALTKIGSKIRSLVNSFRELRMGSFGTSATSKSGVSAGQSVSTMTVHAGVVNVNGKVNGTPGGAGSRKVGNQAIIDNYNRTKETIRGGSTGSSSAASRFAGAKSAGVLGAGLAATFGVMDVMGVKEHSKARLQEAQDTVAYHENQLQSLRQSGATQAQIDAQIREVNDAKAFVARTEKLNHDEEFRAGAVATGYGTAIGADFEFKNPFADFEFKNPFADFEIKNPFEGFEVENPFANLFEGFEPPEIDFSGMADSALAQIEELGG
ncbi:MAG: phage tail tape measure protein, partial [Selenomonadaceae bacterium]|nr:phage tail tape measure protein [Selenomonadaceae bacterium]